MFYFDAIFFSSLLLNYALKCYYGLLLISLEKCWMFKKKKSKSTTLFFYVKWFDRKKWDRFDRYTKRLHSRLILRHPSRKYGKVEKICNG